MANADHLKILQQGVDAWNAWRQKEPSATPDLREGELRGANLSGADLREANLEVADLTRAILYEAKLRGANLTGATLFKSTLRGADFSLSLRLGPDLGGGSALSGTKWVKTNLTDANLIEANLTDADLIRAKLGGADLRRAKLVKANLRGANLVQADLIGAEIEMSDLTGANLIEANLELAVLVDTNLTGADLTGARIYGLSAWSLNLEGSKQQSLVITRRNEPEVTVDNIEVSQFVYLLLHNEKIRDVIDTIGRKGVLPLGRFTGGRMAVLERLREELRKRGYVPMVFNFDKPETKDFTETVRVLAGLSHFVIADVTNPRSAPLELQATVPECMIPFRPIIEEGEEPFAMLNDLWIKHREWVFEPIYYSSLEALVGALDEKIIKPAEVRFAELLARKAEKMKGDHV
jgi:uncharacterized protein YjbI with pentapeptide repeats